MYTKTDYKVKRKEALREFVNNIRERFGSEISSITLYGSEAKGNATKDSDIDVFIVVKSYSANLRRLIIDEASNIFFDRGIDISPLIYGENRADSKFFHITPLYKNIKRDGVAL